MREKARSKGRDSGKRIRAFLFSRGVRFSLGRSCPEGVTSQGFSQWHGRFLASRGLMITLTLTFAAISTLYFLPGTIWEKIRLASEEIGRGLRNRLDILTGKDSRIRREGLMRAISEMEAAFLTGDEKGGSKEIPRYKFFTALVFKILDCARRFGGPRNALLSGLKEGLVKDDHFERQIIEDRKGGYGQFFTVAAITWIFIFVSKHVAFISAPAGAIFMVFVLHLMGLIAFHSLYQFHFQKCFAGFEEIFSCLYTCRSLLGVGLPLSQVAKEADTESVLKKGDVRFDGIRDRLSGLLQRLQKNGAPVEAALCDAISETWFLQERAFEAFRRRLLVIKYIVLIVFFLMAYFVYLFSILSGMLARF